MDNARIAVSSFKQSEDGKAVILRLRSNSEQPEKVRLSWPAGQPTSIRHCLADEYPGDPLSEELAIAPYGVASLRIEF